MEIPAADLEASVRFYVEVFGWKIRIRADGQRAFDDATGGVSGSWVLGRLPSREAGMLIYVMVDSIDACLRKVTEAGGQLATPLTALDGGGAFATFRDPAGNLIGLYQQHSS